MGKDYHAPGPASTLTPSRTVNVSPSQIESLLVGVPECEPQYALVVRREDALDALHPQDPGTQHGQDQACDRRAPQDLKPQIPWCLGPSGPEP